MSGQTVAHFSASPTGSTWTKIASGLTNANGKVAVSLRPTASRKYEIRHTGERQAAAAASRPVTVT